MNFITFNSILASLNGVLPNVLDVLMHLVNFLILAFGLYFLLFKPIKKIVAKKQEEAKRIADENESLNAEVKGMKEEFDTLVAKAKEEAVQIHDEAVKTANQKHNEILEDARVRAKDLITHTEADMKKEKAMLENEIKKEVCDLSFVVAEKIIGREITAKDNEKMIEDCLDEWSKKD